MSPLIRRALPALLALLCLPAATAGAQQFFMRIPAIGLAAAPSGQCSDDPLIDQVATVIHADLATSATAIGDDGPEGFSVTRNGAVEIVTSQRKFGSGSLAFGSGRLDLPSAAAFNFGAGDFTIEMWVRPEGRAVRSIFANNAVRLTYNAGTGSGQLGAEVQSAGQILPLVASGGTPVSDDDTWRHVALQRAGTTLTLFVNGAATGSLSLPGGFTLTAPGASHIGGGDGDAAGFAGHMDEIRVTRAARYGTSFDPPEYRLPDAAGCSDGPSGPAFNTAPSIASIADQTTYAGLATGSIAVTIDDNEQSAFDLTLGAASSNAALVPPGGLALGGGRHDRTLIITPATGQTGAATITLTVSDGALQGQRSFLLTVLDLPGQWLTFGGFRVMKFEAKSDGGSGVTSVAAGQPLVNATLSQARAKCQALGPGVDVLSETQYLALANNAYDQAGNWIGSIGSGTMVRGHSDNAPNSRQAAGTDDNDGYTNTGNNSGQAANSGGEQRRTLILSTGDTIWDLAGNVEEVTLCDRDVCSGGAIPANLNYVGSVANGTYAYTQSGIPSALLPDGTSGPGAGNGVGKVQVQTDSRVRVTRRGGAYFDTNFAGAFALQTFYSTTDGSSWAGYRCSTGH